jgi:hypothetical protein
VVMKVNAGSESVHTAPSMGPRSENRGYVLAVKV